MQSRTLKRLALSGCAGALFAGTTLAAHAAPVSIKYLFNETSDVAIYANPGLDPTSIVPAAITAISSWSDLAGTLIEVPPFTGPDPLTLTNDDGLNGLNQSRAVAARGWDNVTANAFVFSLSIASGFSLAIDQISFFQQGSNGGQGLGPTSWKLFIGGEQAHLGDTATRGSLTQRTLDSSNSFLNTMAMNLEGTVEFRIFATGAQTGTGGTPASNASWRIEEFQISGSVNEIQPIPVPAAAWLFGSALAGLAARRRRAA